LSRAQRGNRSARRTLALIALLVAAVGLTACSKQSTTAPPTPSVSKSVGTNLTGITYWNGDGGPLLVDACLPDKGGEPTAAVILIHGGGFVEGTRSGMKQLCGQLSDSGFAAFTIDYRFAPQFTFPSQVNDVSAAVSWLRTPATAATYNVDPTRIGLVGSSAGAILAQQAGTRGEGSLTTGDRVAAVVSLSGVSLMTAEGLSVGKPRKEGIAMILAYLGCQSTDARLCPQAGDASPMNHVDPSDPPMLLFNSDNEIVPEEQATAMNGALTGAGVRSELKIQPGTQHGVQLLNQQNREQLFEFLKSTLNSGPTP
jgi:acetyl esterase